MNTSTFTNALGLAFLITLGLILLWSFNRQRTKPKGLTDSRIGIALGVLAGLFLIGAAYGPVKESMQIAGYKKAIELAYMNNFGDYLTVRSVDVDTHTQKTMFGSEIAVVEATALLDVHTQFKGCIAIGNAFCLSSVTYQTGAITDTPKVNLRQTSQGWEIAN